MAWCDASSRERLRRRPRERRSSCRTVAHSPLLGGDAAGACRRRRAHVRYVPRRHLGRRRAIIPGVDHISAELWRFVSIGTARTARPTPARARGASPTSMPVNFELGAWRDAAVAFSRCRRRRDTCAAIASHATPVWLSRASTWQSERRDRERTASCVERFRVRTSPRRAGAPWSPSDRCSFTTTRAGRAPEPVRYRQRDGRPARRRVRLRAARSYAPALAWSWGTTAGCSPSCRTT